MKKVLSLFVFLCLHTFGFSQYNPISQILYGDGLERIGYSISLNSVGDRIGLVQMGGVMSNFISNAKVYDLIDNVWHQVGEDVPVANRISHNSSIMFLNQEGNRFVVGSTGYDETDFLQVYELVANEWVQMGGDINSEFLNDFMGSSIDINSLGDVIIHGGSGEDYARVFKLENNEWVQQGQTIMGDFPGDLFGNAVSINADGNIVSVAASFNDENGLNAGKLNFYEFVNNEWVGLGNSIYGQEGDKIGVANGPGNSGINLNREGNIVSVGSYVHINGQGEVVGMAAVHEFLNGSWVQKGQIIEGANPDGYFGGSHSMNDTGDIMAIGDFYGSSEERVIVFSFENNSWVEYASVLPELEHFFGFSLAMNDEGNILAVGAPDEGGAEPSEARLYEYDGVLGVDENELNQLVVLAPNPNKGKFSLDFSEEIAVTSIDVMDALGKTVYSEINVPSGSFEIDQNFTSGVYFVNVISTTSEATLKMIVE